MPNGRKTMGALGLIGLAVAAAGAASGGAQPASSASAPPKPSAAAPASGDVVTHGRELFATWGCSSCHALADAGASGHVGPEFDGDANLTKALVVDRVTNGQGAMPAFGGQMSDKEIDTIATYVSTVAKKGQ